MPIRPLDSIREYLKGRIPVSLIDEIPSRWEKIGDILILRLQGRLEGYKGVIAEGYARYTGCRAVLNDTSGIHGVYREPMFEHIYGDPDTVTIHIENNIRYSLDPQRVMFSSGNMHERIRMANIPCKGETVVDLFAGIGYFTLPVAVYGKPRRVYACELNPVAYGFLKQNITLNNVNDIVEPILGDNRVVAPRGVADRVILGYLHGSMDYIPLAFECLKDYRGVIHYHGLYPDEDIPDKPLRVIEGLAERYNRSIRMDRCVYVKSYAPRISHIVLDIVSR